MDHGGKAGYDCFERATFLDLEAPFKAGLGKSSEVCNLCRPGRLDRDVRTHLREEVRVRVLAARGGVSRGGVRERLAWLVRASDHRDMGHGDVETFGKPVVAGLLARNRGVTAVGLGGATGSGGRAQLLVRLLLPFGLAIHGSSPVRARIAFSARSRSSRKSAGTFRLPSSSAKRRRNSIPAVWPWLAWSLCSGS